MKRETNWPLALCLVLIATLFAPLTAWGYISFSTRYWYDDFCYTAVINKLGFFESQVYWYRNWTGRYSLLFGNALLAYIGPRSASFVGTVLLAAWLAAATWASYQLCSLLRSPLPLVSSLLLGEMIIFATLNSAPDIVASFYWQTGSLVYSLPLILLMLYLGAVLHVLRTKSQLGFSSPWVIAGALLTFAAGGCSEISGGIQIAGLSLLIIVAWRYSSGQARRLLLLMAFAGLLGSVISFSILALAPGNAVRRAAFPQHPQLIQALRSSLSYSLSFVERHTRRNRGTTLVTVLFPFWLAFAMNLSPHWNVWPSPETNRKRLVTLLALWPLAVFLLLTVSFVPGFYLLSEALPPRAHLIPKFILITSTVFWVLVSGLTLVQVLKQQPAIRTTVLLLSSVIVLALALVSPLASARHTFSLRFKAGQSAAAWDVVDKDLRLAASQGVRDVVIPAINTREWELGFGRSDLLPGSDPDAPTNRCLAEYYGLGTITAR